jgi:hypothetical protein
LKKALRTRQANSCGWVNCLGLHGWLYAGSAASPAASASSATARGELLVTLIPYLLITPMTW